MEEVRYMISEAAKRIEVEAHVLRYWQKELDLPILRNEMDQRYYKESDIELLRRVKHLKEQGFQLKAIKMILTNLNTPDSLDAELIIPQQEEMEEQKVKNETETAEDTLDKPEELDAVLREETSLVTDEDTHEIKEESVSKMGQFRNMMNQIILSALRENNGALSQEISGNVTDSVTREMSYLMRLQEEREEERFRKFDMALRDYQKSRMMAAATVDKKRKKSKFMKKNRVYI